jgi:hypothetical protein
MINRYLDPFFNNSMVVVSDLFRVRLLFSRGRSWGFRWFVLRVVIWRAIRDSRAFLARVVSWVRSRRVILAGLRYGLLRVDYAVSDYDGESWSLGASFLVSPGAMNEIVNTIQNDSDYLHVMYDLAGCSGSYYSGPGLSYVDSPHWYIPRGLFRRGSRFYGGWFSRRFVVHVSQHGGLDI